MLDQIPAVAIEILEHRDDAIGLLGGRADEADALRHHRPIVAPEIVGGEEQQHPSPRLIPDEARLIRRRGPGEEDRGGPLPRAGRADGDPALALIGHGRILDQGEPERVDIESKRLVIVADEERDVGEVGH